MKKNVVIAFGNGLFDVKTFKDITHHVNSIIIDSLNKEITISIEHGIKVYQVKLTMQHAEEIGFINFKALGNYCK